MVLLPYVSSVALMEGKQGSTDTTDSGTALDRADPVLDTGI